MKTKTIAVIGAMDCEVNKIKELLDAPKKVEGSFFEIYTGYVDDKFIIVAQSGVGKVNSALHTQFIIDKFQPDCIINTGVAGGVGLNLKVGDIVIGKELVQYDFDVTALGYAKGYLCTGVNKDKPTKFYSDKNLIEKFESAIKISHPEINTHKGLIGTGDTFVSDYDKKKEIRELFNATAVEMEGCAIAQTAAANKIPFLVIRSLSDLADGSAPESLDLFETKMAIVSSLTIASLIKSMD